MSRAGVLTTAVLLLMLAAGYAEHRARHAEADAAVERSTEPSPGTSPLDRVMTPPERDAFTSATADLALLMYADALPVRKGLVRARRGCAALAKRQHPLNVALHETCAPTIDLARISVLALRACNRGWRPCVQRMHERARILEALALSERRLSRAVRRTLPAGTCRDALAPAHSVIGADLLNAQATRRYGDAMAAGDEGWGAAEHRRMHAAARVVDRQLVYVRAEQIARACNLPSWSFKAR